MSDRTKSDKTKVCVCPWINMHFHSKTLNSDYSRWTITKMTEEQNSSRRNLNVLVTPCKCGFGWDAWVSQDVDTVWLLSLFLIFIPSSICFCSVSVISVGVSIVRTRNVIKSHVFCIVPWCDFLCHDSSPLGLKLSLLRLHLSSHVSQT